MNQENATAIIEGTGIKVAVIGVGNGGSQSAIAAVRHGIPAMVFNTSEKDLDDSLIGSQIKGYLIGDGRGSGKDRDNAMALLKSNGKGGIKEIFTNPHFKATVEPADVVFVTFSTGGGTGSGIGPTLASMIHKAYGNKVVIPYGILPKNAESVLAHANSIACVDDMTKTGTPYLRADLGFYENESQELAFAKIGEYRAETMCVIRGDYLTMSTSGMADERDMLTVISEPGYMTINMKRDITETMLASKTLQSFLVDEIKSSPACRIQKDQDPKKGKDLLKPLPIKIRKGNLTAKDLLIISAAHAERGNCHKQEYKVCERRDHRLRKESVQAVITVGGNVHHHNADTGCRAESVN